MKQIFTIFICILIMQSGVWAQKQVKKDVGQECRATEEAYFKAHPEERLEAEKSNKFALDYAKKLKSGATKAAVEYVIPVVFHVFGTNFNGKSVTDALVIDALERTNEDFQGLTPDWNDVMPEYDGIKEALPIKFKLAQIDPDGNPTTGITYNPYEEGFGEIGTTVENKIRQYAWDNYKYFNVYIMNVLYDDGATNNSGVAWWPIVSMSDENIARVVYNGAYLGNNTDENFRSILTHEFGHYLDLKHTFQGGCPDDVNCTVSGDFICDTPPADYSHLDGAKNCEGVVTNWENFMDYTINYSMYTNDQVTRMRAALEHSTRRPLWQPSNLEATGTVDKSIYADYSISTDAPVIGSSITVTDNSQSTAGSITSWQWTFNGGSPSAYNGKNPPSIQYNSVGTYEISLTVTNSTENDTRKMNIRVRPQFSELTMGFEACEDFTLTDFGSWTVNDVDADATYNHNSTDFPGEGGQMAYIAFNSSTCTPPFADLGPHSGQMVGACFGSAPSNNDWFISPKTQLGTNSEFSVWVRSYDAYSEKYNVLVSTSTNSPSSFNSISGSSPKIASETWEQDVYDISSYDGQEVYIAIQCVSDDQFVFFIDDLKITTSTEVDTENPSTPSNLSYSSVTHSSVTLSWNASSDNVGVTGYDVYQGGSYVKTVSGTSTTMSGLAASTPYSFNVRAKDAAGNISNASNTVNATTATAPTCTEVTLTLTLDAYPEETSWDFKDESGSVVLSGGTYPGEDGAVKVENICLEDGCYDITIYDSYGDGLEDAPEGNYVVKDEAGNTLASMSTPDFGYDETTNFCIGSVNPVNYILTTNVVGNGSVTPGGSYNAGDVVQITATPNSGYQFDGWSGDLSGSTNPVNIVMNSDKNVTATFTEIPVGGGGDVSIIGNWVEGTSNTAPSGTDRLLVVTAHVEHNVPGISLNALTYGGVSMTKVEDVNGGGTTYQAYTAIFVLKESGITSASGNTIVPTWSTNPYRDEGFSSVFLSGVNQSTSIGATTSNGVNGPDDISADPLSTADGDMVIVAATSGVTGSYVLNNGFTEEVELTIGSGDAVAGYKAATGVAETPSATQSGSTRQSIVGVVVKAGSGGTEPTQYTLTIVEVGEGRVTLSPDAPGGVYDDGDVVLLTASAPTGYRFVGWSGALSGSTNPTTITMNANKTVTATFSEIQPQYTLTTNVTGNGSVSPSGGTYNAGTIVQLTAIPDAGNEFVGWSGDASGTANTVSVTMNGDKTVTAAFIEIPQDLIYCDAIGNSSVYEHITRVQFGSIDKSSGRQGYADHTSESTILTAGVATTLSITTVENYSTDEMKVYIDYNYDGDFTDAGEEVYHVTDASSVKTYTTNITAPSNAVSNKNLRMRIVLWDASYSSQIPPCGTFSYGEVEDYTIYILGSGSGEPMAKAAIETSAYPNPNDGNFTIKVASESAGEVVVNINDIYGKSVATLTTIKATGTVEIPVNVSLVPGYYYAQVVLNNAEIAVVTFLVQ